MGESKLFEGVISLQFHYFSSFETPTSLKFIKEVLKENFTFVLFELLATGLFKYV